MKPEIKKLLILNLPYLLFVWLFDKAGAAVRLSPGADASAKLLHLGDGFTAAFSSIAPRGERYELCRSVHAEANAIISASRRDMVGGTLYLVGRNAQTGELLTDATSCPMCRRMVINAGLSRVVIRRTPEEFTVVDVEEWVRTDDLALPEKI